MEGQQRSWIIVAAASAAVAAGAWAVWKSRWSRQGSTTLAKFFSRIMRISFVPLVCAWRRDAAGFLRGIDEGRRSHWLQCVIDGRACCEREKGRCSVYTSSFLVCGCLLLCVGPVILARRGFRSSVRIWVNAQITGSLMHFVPGFARQVLASRATSGYKERVGEMRFLKLCIY